MRTLVALVLLVLGGFLIWHGVKTADPAKAELAAAKTKVSTVPNFDRLLTDYPYSSAAIDAHEVILATRIDTAAKQPAGKIPGKDELKTLATGIPDRAKKGFSNVEPYVQPDAAAIVGLAGLLLALLLPGTRFRGLAFLGVLFGGAAIIAGMVPPENQVALVNKVGPIRHVISNFPRVAQACVVLAAITLAARVGGGKARASD